MLDPGTGTLQTTLTVAAVVFALYLVRAWGIAPFATVFALGHGFNAPGLVAMRLLSDLLLIALLSFAVQRWMRAREGRAPGRIDGWLARLREAVASGSVFLNALTVGYLVNSYIVFALIPTLPRGRRRALAGALAGELAGFVLDLVAILGLSALIGGSRTLLTVGVTALALGVAVVNHLLQRRPRPAPVAEAA